MTGGQKGKFVTRLFALLFVGMAFAVCAAILSSKEGSLFVDIGRAARVR